MITTSLLLLLLLSCLAFVVTFNQRADKCRWPLDFRILRSHAFIATIITTKFFVETYLFVPAFSNFPSIKVFNDVFPIIAPLHSDIKKATDNDQQQSQSPQLKNKCTGMMPNFDPSGTYYIKEQGYASFDHFTIRVKESGVKLSASGFATLVDGSQIKFSSSTVTKEILRFETQKHEGIQYKFDGKWLVNNVFAESKEFSGKDLLYGTLLRLKNDKGRTKIRTSFRYQPEC